MVTGHPPVGEDPQHRRVHRQLLERRAGDAHADVTNIAYTITGSAYGINSSNHKVIMTDFKITAEC